ncbi:hypothetical protein KVR01_009077 [Diaporthe batatas]|uniref:uncharacterized protein n=1 Tax=Diaporthe batatas TaxID=748121 RepID=UPI001D05ADB2|nr:uncharacterized protein KVR01_009077 [Diaporthe batatas]KAG8160813.1 hypothetical protein KVR01_009077 [Diaporthe batatas]
MLGLLPSAEDGILPYYLLLVSVAAIGNAVQNLMTLHYTRRIYNGLFVPRASANPDAVDKLQPLADAPSLKDKPTGVDQVTPLAARLFGVYTVLAGLIRLYGAYRVHDPVLYQMCLITHLLAAVHFTSEAFVFKTVKLGWEHAFPFSAAISGSVWMTLYYSHYVKA